MDTDSLPAIDELVKAATPKCVFEPPSPSYIAYRLGDQLGNVPWLTRGTYLSQILTHGSPFDRRVAAIAAFKLYTFHGVERAEDDEKKVQGRKECLLAGTLERIVLDRGEDPAVRSIALLAREKLELLDHRVPRVLAWDRFDVGPGVDELRCLVGGKCQTVAVAAAEALSLTIHLLSSQAASVTLYALLGAIENGEPLLQRTAVEAVGHFGKRWQWLGEKTGEDSYREPPVTDTLHRYLGRTTGEDRLEAITAMVMMGLCTPEAHDALLLTLAEELSPKGTFSAALTAMSFKSDRDKGELVHALTALRGKQRGPHAANAIESAISLRTVLRDKPPRQHQPPADSTAGRRAEQLVSC